MTASEFLATGIIGLVVLLISLAIGDSDSDADFDADVDTDVDVDTEVGGNVMASILSLLSLKALSAGLVGFGFMGWAFSSQYSNELLIWLAALIAALFSWGTVVFLLMPWLKKQQGTDMQTVDTYVGLSGSVISPIPDEGIGTVQLTDRTGLVTQVDVVSANGTPIPMGEKVLIIDAVPGKVAAIPQPPEIGGFHV